MANELTNQPFLYAFQNENQKQFTLLWNMQQFPLPQSYVNSGVLFHNIVWRDMDQLYIAQNITLVQ